MKSFIWKSTEGRTDALLYINKKLREKVADLTSALSVLPGVGSWPYLLIVIIYVIYTVQY